MGVGERPFAHVVTLDIWKTNPYLYKSSKNVSFDKMLKYYVPENPYFIYCFFVCVSIVAGEHLEDNFKDYEVSAIGV